MIRPEPVLGPIRVRTMQFLAPGISDYLGILCEALRFILPAGYVVYGLFLLIWFGVIGWKLYWLDTPVARLAISQGSRVVKSKVLR